LLPDGQTISGGKSSFLTQKETKIFYFSKIVRRTQYGDGTSRLFGINICFDFSGESGSILSFFSWEFYGNKVLDREVS
jgi:hypothetical protein